MKLLLLAATCAMAGAAGIALSQEGEAPVPAGLSAARVEKGPELSAELTDAWRAAPVHTVRVQKGKGADVDVDLRVMHDGTNIYIFARWADPDASIVKGAWRFTETGWERTPGDEDRIAFAFNISAEGFDTEGCTALCHDDAMRTAKEGQLADLWHWKAARGGMHGWSDDQQFKFAQDSGRVDDAGSSAYRDNKAADGKGPARRWKDDAKRDGAFDDTTSVDIDVKFKPALGDSVPAILLRKPAGSRDDIEAVGRYADGHWQVMFRRALNTGNADDAMFKAGESVSMAVAVFDNTGASTGKEHKKSGPFKLKLAP